MVDEREVKSILDLSFCDYGSAAERIPDIRQRLTYLPADMVPQSQKSNNACIINIAVYYSAFAGSLCSYFAHWHTIEIGRYFKTGMQKSHFRGR